MTFDNLATEFEKWYQDKCLNTKLTYGNSLRKLRENFGNQDISQLPIRDFSGTILDRRVLKRMLHLACEWGHLDNIPRIRIAKERVRTRFLTKEELDREVESARNQPGVAIRHEGNGNFKRKISG